MRKMIVLAQWREVHAVKGWAGSSTGKERVRLLLSDAVYFCREPLECV